MPARVAPASAGARRGARRRTACGPENRTGRNIGSARIDGSFIDTVLCVQQPACRMQAPGARGSACRGTERSRE
ncbi:hypothetical protein WT27_15350 [Burkholderia territorii]|uniref:Uncharacterized protein n=1 Tax=Burkholderia territorii TaxID=1503055 RepID=A0A105V072_9BURK|nr:hypothetical protein WT27_15350 [Burkholderia territorii]KVX42187.1 hypothetical protein WT31_28585 [Burkholderia territorii]